MPFSLQLPPDLEHAGWKVKIQDRERLEPPHVTIIKGTERWRMNLRTEQFMDRKPDSAEVPKSLVAHIQEAFEMLRRQWDVMYPGNPVNPKSEDVDE